MMLSVLSLDDIFLLHFLQGGLACSNRYLLHSLVTAFRCRNNSPSLHGLPGRKAVVAVYSDGES